MESFLLLKDLLLCKNLSKHVLCTCVDHILCVCVRFMICRIGLSEKGQAVIKLSVSVAPGHSSMPPRETSIGILATAVKR